MNPIIELAKQSVLDIHIDIAHVFTRNQAGDLPWLEQAFHPEFTMIAMNGSVLSLEQVKMLFQSKQGTRENLVIEIANVHVIGHCQDAVWLNYQETHQENGSKPQRTSTACVKVEGDHWQWVYLHETMLSQ